jgi:hypothetical protein
MEENREEMVEAVKSGTVVRIAPKTVPKPRAEIVKHLEESIHKLGLPLSEFAADLPPMRRECRLSICIPVAAHEEQDYIYRTLKSFSRQTARPDSFEIILFLNHPDRRLEGEFIAPDRTAAEIKRFQSDFPGLQVHAFYRVIPRDLACIGLVRRMLTDTVLFRHRERKHAPLDHIMVSADADTCGVAKTFVEQYLRLFRQNPRIGAYAGKTDGEWPLYVKSPLLLFGERFAAAVSSYLRSVENIPLVPGGANTAFRASRYSRVGGYSPSASAGEDSILSNALRKSGRFPESSSIRSAGSGARIWTSSRRGLAAAQRGYSSIRQWTIPHTEFGTENAGIRAGRDQIQDDFEFELARPDFNMRVTSVIAQTLAFHLNPFDARRKDIAYGVLERFFHLSVAYDEPSGLIIVENSDRFKAYLRNFREHALRYWKENLGFEE